MSCIQQDYQYYLDNGVLLKYTLAPGSSLVQVIDNLAAEYAHHQINSLPDFIWVMPYIASALNKECMVRERFLLGPPSPGNHILCLQTIIGPLKVIARMDLEFPLFIGTEQEHETNGFFKQMGKLLNE